MSEHKIITRFAPSPTGMMHLGNARVAILCWLHARSNNGKFILRIDDTDTERCKKEYENSIYSDLKWLLLDWDLTEKQTDHYHLFLEKIQNLKQNGILYQCYETKEELELKRKAMLSSGMPPIYDRNSIYLTKKQIDSYKSEGRKPHWRFKIDHTDPILVQDMIRGEIKFNPSKLSDPIVIKNDDTYTYILISVISDIKHRITDIIRGEDHIVNTAIQTQMFKVLGYKIPYFAHLPLLKIESGKISKRKGEGDYTISKIKEKNIDPLAIINHITSIGHSNINLHQSITDIMKNFNIKSYSTSVPTIYIEDIIEINTKLLRNMDYESIINKIDIKYKKIINQNNWNIIRHNISNIIDIEEWANIINGNFMNTQQIDKNILKNIVQIIETEIQNNTTEEIKKCLKKIINSLNYKPKDIFISIRLALTGKNNGPELFSIIQILNKQETINRINNEINR